MSRENFDYSDINLIPKLGIVKSRNECDTSVNLGNYYFILPVYPANMESIINQNIAFELARKGYFYTMHRFLSDVEHVDFIQTMRDNLLPISISVGIGNKWEVFLTRLKKEFKLMPDFITIDIAHGHSIGMKDMIDFIKNLYPNTFLIAGNIATVEAANDLAEWGVDAVKVGVAPGKVCITAMATGFGTRGIQASTIEEISNGLTHNIKIIADGGIREHGDIAKALVMGADMIMAGSIFSGFRDSPGDAIVSTETGEGFKEYWGSASSFQSGKTNRIEGTMIKVPFKDRSIITELKSIEESLQSAISYAGGRDLNAFTITKYKIKN